VKAEAIVLSGQDNLIRFAACDLFENYHFYFDSVHNAGILAF
jgi:hypothetical protein